MKGYLIAKEPFTKGSCIYGLRLRGVKGHLSKEGSVPARAGRRLPTEKPLPSKQIGHGHGRQSAHLWLPSENCIALAMPLGWLGQGTSHQTCWPKLSLKDDTGYVSLLRQTLWDGGRHDEGCRGKGVVVSRASL